MIMEGLTREEEEISSENKKLSWIENWKKKIVYNLSVLHKICINILAS